MLDLLQALWPIILIFAVIIAGREAIRWALGRGEPLSAEALAYYQASLLEAVKDRSADQGALVKMDRFWSSTGLNGRQRNDVAEPLIEGGHLAAVYRSSGDNVTDWLRRYVDGTFHVAPSFLRLTDKTWTQMVHSGLSGESIVIERIETMNWQSAGRDIVGSPQTVAGGSAQIRTGSSKINNEVAGLPIEALDRLVAALHSDASSLEGQRREKAEALANELENALDEQTPDEGLIESKLSHAERLVNRAGGLMTATERLLTTWGRITPDA